MEYIAHSLEGFVHFITAMIAMLAGTVVLFANKGTQFHKRWGYVYFVSMTIMLGTSFMIYMVFDGFGMFHYGAVGSSITLLAGFIPVFFRRPKSNWLEWHFSMMYWSVIGLYAAFFAEALTRIPKTPFLAGVGVTFVLTMIVGGILWGKFKGRWAKQFSARMK